MELTSTDYAGQCESSDQMENFLENDSLLKLVTVKSDKYRPIITSKGEKEVILSSLAKKQELQ